MTAGTDTVSQLQRGPAARSVGRLLDDVGGERVVAGDADGVAGQRVRAPPWRFATGEAQAAQRGEEDLAVGGRHQVVEDGVDGRAHVEENVGQHVEVVVEVVQIPVRTRTTGGGQRSAVTWFTQTRGGVCIVCSRAHRDTLKCEDHMHH